VPRLSILALMFVPLILQGLAAAGPGFVVPYQERWGIYELNPEAPQVRLIYTCPERITGLKLDVNSGSFAFSQRIGADESSNEEICVLGVDGEGFLRLTENGLMDVYPAWSPDGSRIAFLSWRGETLDIYVMDRDGGNVELLYDSGLHDADIHWVGDRIAFTRGSSIWIMNQDGTGATRLTDPPRAGEWGGAVLPFGDYDPRISPDGGEIVFERMVGDATRHGCYDLYLIQADGTGEIAITETGWTQGLASWSHAGDRLVFSVTAVGEEGRYDIFTVEPDGGGLLDMTSDLFPPGFLAHGSIFSEDDSKIYFVGEWWNWRVLETSITCDVSPGEAIEGEEVTVTGSIEPAVSGAAVTIECSMPDGSTLTRTVKTGSDGSYEDAFEAVEAGRWTVEASWEGDRGHEASRSQPLEFTVAEPAERGGIPGFPVESVAIGLAVWALARIHRRKSGP